MFFARHPGRPDPVRHQPAGGSESIIQTTATLQTGWHHLAVVIDAAKHAGAAPLDGDVAASGLTAILPKDLGSTTQNWLGARSTPPTRTSPARSTNSALQPGPLGGEVRYL
jgi:hypothetical protein